MNEKEKPLVQWDFDHYSHEHWNEIKANNVDKTRSWVELAETPSDDGVFDGNELALSVFVNKEKKLQIFTFRDQWGTYITFSLDGKGFTVNQEDETMSFVDSLIAGLTQLKNITDFGTKPPIMTEIEKPFQ